MKINLLLTLQLVAIGVLVNLRPLTAQIKMNSSGKVGIGVNPTSEMLYIYGDTRFYAWYSDILYDYDAGDYGGALIPESNNTCNLGTSVKAFKHIHYYNLHLSSDSTQKENVRDIENSLDIISGLKGIRFDFKREVFLNEWNIKDSHELEKMEYERKNKIGFIAQDMIHVLPEAVFVDDSSGLYTIDYTRVIPVLVNAINEQQKLINNLTIDIENLKKDEPIKKAQTDNMSNEREIIQTSYLLQNSPNPFKTNTRIEYVLSADVIIATIFIYNMNGTQLKRFDLNQKGSGSITINAGELSPGMYMYSLITDDKLIDTKRMILTD